MDVRYYVTDTTASKNVNLVLCPYLFLRTWTCQCQSILSINARDTRATVLEQSLRKLGVERLTKDDVQKMQWEVLEAKIGNWIHYMYILG